MSATPVEIARGLHARLEAGMSGEALRDLFTPDAETLEHPNAIKPKGATTTLEQMLTASVAGAGLLAQQHYDLLEGHSHGDVAVLRLLWRGTVAADAGPFKAGQELAAHIAQFVTTREGRIARIETYDCYEPFAADRR